MNIIPLLTAAPMAVSTAANVVRQVPDRAASFLTLLANAIDDQRPPGSAPGAVNGRTARPGGDFAIGTHPLGMRSAPPGLTGGVTSVAAGARRLVGRIRAGVLNTLRDAGIQTSAPVRLQVRADGDVVVKGSAAARDAIQRAITDDGQLATSLRELRTLWREQPFELIARGPLADRNGT